MWCRSKWWRQVAKCSSTRPLLCVHCVYMGVGDGELWHRSSTKFPPSMPLPPPPRGIKTRPSVANVAVLVPDDPQEVEAEGQQGGAQQVPQCRQVRDGEAVGVFAAAPHWVDHPVGNAQQQQHLEEGEEDKEVETVWNRESQGYTSAYTSTFVHKKSALTLEKHTTIVCKIYKFCSKSLPVIINCSRMKWSNSALVQFNIISGSNYRGRLFLKTSTSGSLLSSVSRQRKK